MRFARYVVAFVVVVFFVLAISRHNKVDNPAREYAESIHYDDAELFFQDSLVLDVAFAETSRERTQGLSGQQNLLENQGLLFKFPSAGLHGIWMRDMNFAIDIIWLDEDLVVIDIKKNATPESYRSEFDAEVFKPEAPALYVLEVLSGFVDKSGVRAGDIFSLREKSKK